MNGVYRGSKGEHNFSSALRADSLSSEPPGKHPSVHSQLKIEFMSDIVLLNHCYMLFYLNLLEC